MVSSSETGGGVGGAGPPASGEVAETELQAGALGFWGVIIQAVTHIAPGLNVLLGLTFIVSFAGVTAPIAYVIGGVICLGVAVVLDAAREAVHGRRAATSSTSATRSARASAG